MEKGVNTLIVDAKDEITNIINEYCKMGIPISVFSLILNDIQRAVVESTNQTIKQEKEYYENAKKQKNAK